MYHSAKEFNVEVAKYFSLYTFLLCCQFSPENKGKKYNVPNKCTHGVTVVRCRMGVQKKRIYT